MRAERAAVTALSGGSISEESFAISTAIFAAPYAALQADSLDEPGSSGAVSVELQDGKPIDSATALEVAASALWSLAWGWNVASPWFMHSTIGDVGVGGGLFVGVAERKNLSRKLRMVDTRIPASVCPNLTAWSSQRLDTCQKICTRDP